MPTIDEAVTGYIAAIKVMDIGTLMATLTPDDLGKAMANMGSQPQPTSISDITPEKISEENGEYVYNLTIKADGNDAVMMTKWKEIDGAWKVIDIGQA